MVAFTIAKQKRSGEAQRGGAGLTNQVRTAIENGIDSAKGFALLAEPQVTPRRLWLRGIRLGWRWQQWTDLGRCQKRRHGPLCTCGAKQLGVLNSRAAGSWASKPVEGDQLPLAAPQQELGAARALTGC